MTQLVFWHLHTLDLALPPKATPHTRDNYYGHNSTHSVTVIEQLFCFQPAESQHKPGSIHTGALQLCGHGLRFTLPLLPAVPERQSEGTSTLHPALSSVAQMAGF